MRSRWDASSMLPGMNMVVRRSFIGRGSFQGSGNARCGGRH